MAHEKEFKIPIPGTEKHIYAKQYGELDRPVVVLVHGLTGFMDEHQLYNAARYFYERGFSSVRFNLYDFPKDARKLVDCTLETHAQDVDIVVDYLKSQGAAKIFAAGHSYGAPSIILSQQTHLSAIALWDGTDHFIFDEATAVPGTDMHLVQWGASFVIGDSMYKEAMRLTWPEVIQHIQVPAKFVWAGKTGRLEERQKLLEQVSVEHSYAVVEHADHIFAVEGTAEKLFDETLDWFKRFV